MKPTKVPFMHLLNDFASLIHSYSQNHLWNLISDATDLYDALFERVRALRVNK